MYVYFTMLCKALESFLISLDCVRKIGNRCPELLKHVQIYTETQYIQQNTVCIMGLKVSIWYDHIDSSTHDAFS